jgi:hypothetical protein
MTAVVPWAALEALIEPTLSQSWFERRPPTISDRRDVAHLLFGAVV